MELKVTTYGIDDDGVGTVCFNGRVAATPGRRGCTPNIGGP